MIPGETSPLFELASQQISCAAGVVRSTSTETHVKESDGSCTCPGGTTTFDAMEESEASVEGGKDV